MTKLILGSLLAAAAIGCMSSTTETGHISATWSFHDIALTGNSVVESPTGCPQGFDTVALHTAAATADGTLVDSCTSASSDCFIDLFTCSDMAGTSSALPAQNYLTWIEVTDNSGTSQYAQTVSTFVDITNVDKTVSVDILNNGGYFTLTWDLVGASSGSAIPCTATDAASAAGGSVEITSTINGTSLAASDKFNCEDHEGFSAGLPADTYTVSIDALNSSDAAISDPTVLTNKVIGANQANELTDLGHIAIPITGM